MKFARAILCMIALAHLLPVYAGQYDAEEFRARYFRLCDAAAGQLVEEHGHGRFFADSYAVRALCAAYDMTGNTNYLAACRAWSERMVKYQERMIPPGAYYMNYNRKPGETTNDWYSADSSSIGMAVLATSVRCQGAEKKRFQDSAKAFAELVINNFVRPSGGVSDGLWHESTNEWWCSSALFGSFLFNLHACTGDKRYLQTALRVTDWLDAWDPDQDQPFPLSQQGPAMIFYVMENYSAGWPYLVKDDARRRAALPKINWCLAWMKTLQQKPLAGREWPPAKSWGLKSGGLPFHEYVFARYFPEDHSLMAAGDTELELLAPLVMAGKSDLPQLPMFMLMSYAERLNPGAIYKNGR